MKKQSLLLLNFFLWLLSYSQPGTIWSPLGPNTFPVNASGQINGIGRCTQLKFDPLSQNGLYITSASGGLWHSNDTGSTWINLNTDYFPQMNCASICADPTNSNILYLGSGDPNYYNGGYGVWKSTNAGLSWTMSNTGINTGLIVEILINPANNQELIAATDNGIYKSTDAGANWSLIKNGGDFKAMVIKPNSVDTVYAVNSSELWRSFDFGASWQQITTGINVPNGNGQGMRLAVSKADPSVVYIGMIANEGLILKSTDYGTTFSTVYNNPSQSLVGYNATTPGQGDYNFSMTADPSDANTVYVAAHCVWKSTDGGFTWSKLTSWATECHTDMHGIAVHPNYPTMLYDINDGGVFISRDGGNTWLPKSNGIAATEIYHAAQSRLQRSTISIGTQDNGELYMAPGNNWFTNRGGDWGSKMKFSYGNNYVYYYQNGQYRTVNGLEVSYNLPFAFSNTICLEFNRKLPAYGFSAQQNIYKCSNINNFSPTWSQIGTVTDDFIELHSSFADSSILYAISDNNLLYRCTNIFSATPVWNSFTTPGPTNFATCITSIATNSNIVYLSCGSTIYRSLNAGQNFSSFSTGITGGFNILQMYHDEYSGNEGVYACTAKGVYYRNSAMNSWQNISYNLPTIANINEFIVYNSGDAASVLRVGYYGRGMWELPINTSLPPVPQFTVDKQVICPNTSITFSDQSIGNPISWQWSFPNGSPATSTIQNPSVTYSSSGVYPVSLNVYNANGSSSLTLSAYINVTVGQALPFSESFAGTFPPTNWTLFDDGNDNVNWQQNLTVGGFYNTLECAYFDNFNVDVMGKRDEMRTESYELGGLNDIKLFFDVAYARYDPAKSDSLEVLASNDCGQSFTSVYLKGGSMLATAPDNTGQFLPTADQWRTDTIYLGSFTGERQMLFAFRNRGHFGNEIYLDDINLSGSTLTVTVTAIAKQMEEAFVFEVFPNPVHEKVFVSFSSTTVLNGILSITEPGGRRIYQKNMAVKPGKYTESIDVSAIPKGLYLIGINDGCRDCVKKLVIN